MKKLKQKKILITKNDSILRKSRSHFDRRFFAKNHIERRIFFQYVKPFNKFEQKSKLKFLFFNYYVKK